MELFLDQNFPSQLLTNILCFFSGVGVGAIWRLIHRPTQMIHRGQRGPRGHRGRRGRSG